MVVNWIRSLFFQMTNGAVASGSTGASSTTIGQYYWTPAMLIDGQGEFDDMAIVLLNRPILLDKNYFTTVWNGGKWTVPT